VTIHRWVRRFTALFIEAARDRRLPVGRRWHVDETYVRVGGSWRYLYRAIDERGQVVDVLLSERRDATAAREFFLLARLRTTGLPEEVVTDRAAVYPQVLRDLLPWVTHETGHHANCPIESDHARLKARLRPMHGLKNDQSAEVIVGSALWIVGWSVEGELDDGALGTGVVDQRLPLTSGRDERGQRGGGERSWEAVGDAVEAGGRGILTAGAGAAGGPVRGPPWSARRIVTVAQGRIKNVIHDRGFGFVRANDGNEVFFHRTGNSALDFDSLEEGEVVTFDVVPSPKGPRARNMQRAR